MMALTDEPRADAMSDNRSQKMFSIETLVACPAMLTDRFFNVAGFSAI